MEMEKLQRKMIGHGILMFSTMLFAGVGLWSKLLDGYEIYPGKIINFKIPGTDESWRKAHTGPALNGLMVLATAAILPKTGLSEKRAARLGRIVVADGWGNVAFYLSGNFTENRVLSFGPNKWGRQNIFSTIGLAPAYLFGVLNCYALPVIGWNALKNAKNGAKSLTAVEK